MSRSDSFTPQGSGKETTFLEGPHSRWKEFRFIIGVLREFIYGFRKLHFVGPCVTVFGSARFQENHPYYEMARKTGQAIVKLGFSVMTGGGPGIMEAANRGAREAGGHSIGCNIVLPKEQKPNKYLDKWVEIDYFFLRKILLNKYSYAFIVFPGGFGTMDEFFEAITLIQTGKTKKFPIILMGKSFYEELFGHIEKMVQQKTIDPDDTKLFFFTDSIEDAMDYINRHAIEGFGLRKRKKVRPLTWLGEYR